MLIPHVEREYARGHHSMPAAAFTALAQGMAGPAEVGLLAAAQQSVSRLRVAKRSADHGPAWQVLAELDASDRAAVDDVLGYPYVRAWAADAGQGHPGHLASIAAAAAVRAAEPAELQVPVIAGLVHLPSIGRMRVGGAGPARVRTGAGSFTVHAGGREYAEGCAEWEPVRALRATGVSVLLDDLDVHRDCFTRPVRGRLEPSDLAIWQKVFREGWDFLLERHPAQAAAVRSGLRVITPLAGEPGNAASARHAYGAIALSEVCEPETFAALLVREFMTAQLRALLDMYHITGGDPGAERLLLQTYDRILTMRLLNQHEAEGARRDATGSLDVLLREPLPDIGLRFITQMRASLTSGRDAG